MSQKKTSTSGVWHSTQRELSLCAQAHQSVCAIKEALRWLYEATSESKYVDAYEAAIVLEQRLAPLSGARPKDMAEVS